MHDNDYIQNENTEVYDNDYFENENNEEHVNDYTNNYNAGVPPGSPGINQVMPFQKLKTFLMKNIFQYYV